MLLQRRDQKDEREAHCPLEVIKEVAAKGTGGRVSVGWSKKRGRLEEQKEWKGGAGQRRISELIK